MTQAGPTVTGIRPRESTNTPISFLTKFGNRLSSSIPRRGGSNRVFDALPQTSQDRLDATLSDKPFDIQTLAASLGPGAEEKAQHETVLYLAYGSNLCKETFRGVRGIQPLSQVNVVVPSLRLTFDLPGIPYAEPCFANTAPRTPKDHGKEKQPGGTDYHKNRWHKGLVGVVYEVTRSDYAHIIATEGGGASYQDILVDCHVLLPADTVPSTPTSRPFKAHTLFAPIVDDGKSDRVHRPDPSYAQPSARYLKLITDGATECELPAEYRAYLDQIRSYTITSKRQAAGKALFLAIWLPFVMFIFTLSRQLQDKKGRSPWWLAKISALMFVGIWLSYDGAFKGVFGDGERTVGDDALRQSRRESFHDQPVSRAYMERETLMEGAVETMYRQGRRDSRDEESKGVLI